LSCLKESHESSTISPEFNDKDVVHELHALDRETLARLLFHGLVDLKKIVPVVLSQPALERDEQNPKRKHALLDLSLMVVPLAIKRFNVLDDVGGRCHATSHCEDNYFCRPTTTKTAGLSL